MEPVQPSTGWGVTHLYYRVTPGGPADAAQAGKELHAAIDAFTTDGTHQILASSVLGLKADLGLMALGPDLTRHDQLARDLARSEIGRALTPTFSYLSLTETSEYQTTVDEARARLVAEHGETDDLEAKLAPVRDRLEKYAKDKLNPLLPRRRILAFYPMSKARETGANWYRLPYEERRKLMYAHGAVGRKYAGRILQLVTGSTGLDEHEWGVTLLADDLDAVKEIVYEMRFDEVTASYGRFGDFLIGLTLENEQVAAHFGLA